MNSYVSTKQSLLPNPAKATTYYPFGLFVSYPGP